MTFAEFEQWARVGSYLFAPILAIVGATIAWQQWRLNARKFEADLYDRRLRIYQEVVKALSLFRQRGADPNELQTFRVAVSEADFLFRPEIMEYIEEVYSHGLDRWQLDEDFKDLNSQQQPDPAELKRVSAGRAKETRWIREQFGVAKARFAKYLSIGRSRRL